MLAAGQRLCGLCRKHANLHRAARSMCYVNVGPEYTFTDHERRSLEKLWKSRLNEQDSKQATRQPGQKKYYVLSMFPYPSGQLHMGHVRVYTISDVMARYHRLKGEHVIHPMGWDAFGLPAENAAIERGEQADIWTQKNIASMKSQMNSLHFSFDWKDEFATSDPEYYRWTQYLFLKMHEKGLVYQKMGQVNWDPVDETVLAAEQIDEKGRSWRSGALVEKRYLKQWYIKTTMYTQSLLDGLTQVKSGLWKDIIAIQRQWLGVCNDGVRLEFNVQHGDEMLDNAFSVFTHNPECLYGASHIVISHGHYFNDKQYHKKKTADDELTGYTELDLTAISPITGKVLPIVVDNNWTTVEVLDSRLAIPDIDENDLNLAQSLSLEYREVVDESDKLKNSEQISGMSRSEAFEAITLKAKELGCGGNITSEVARDWLISRQRYWGTPIPIIHCPKKGAVPVPYHELPVRLPKVTNLTGKGQSALAAEEDWLKVKCPGCDCDGYGRRETDTMDTFVDSSWYFLRYIDSQNTQEPFSSENARTDMPVDLYIGGKEHATMHLYYARFFNHFLHDLGLVPEREPFVNLLTQGLVKGLSYHVVKTNKFLSAEEVDLSVEPPVEKATGDPVEKKWFKMSKSKHNGVDPQDILDQYGCDVTRLGILSNVAPKSDRNWDMEVFKGVTKWQSRLWLIMCKVEKEREYFPEPIPTAEEDHFLLELKEARNYFVNQVTHHMDNTFLLSVAISRLQGLTNTLMRILVRDLSSIPEGERALGDLLIMIAPFCPMFAMALWDKFRVLPGHVYDGFNWDGSVWEQRWPVVDKDYRISMKVKVNGKTKLHIPLHLPLDEIEGLTREQAKSVALSHPPLEEHVVLKDIRQMKLVVDGSARVELDLKVNIPLGKRRKKKKR